MMKIGEKIRELRGNRYSQEELADKLQVHNNTISRWESGIMAPKLKYIQEMAKIFNVSPEYLLNDAVQEQQISTQTFNKSLSYQDTTEIKGTESSVAYWGTVVDNAEKVSVNNPNLVLILHMAESAVNALRAKLSAITIAPQPVSEI